MPQLAVNMKVKTHNKVSRNLKNNRFKMRHAAYLNRQTVKLPTKANYFRLFSADCGYR